MLRQVGVMLQENVLLNRSVRDNIALSVPGASMEAVVRGADRIITVERGRVVEDGTHEALVRSGGRYAGLWAHQTAGAQT